MTECPVCGCHIAVTLNLNHVTLIIEDGGRVFISSHRYGDAIEIDKQDLNEMLLDYYIENFNNE